MKTQYRLSTNGNWQSYFGRGLLVISNVSGSGRKLTIRSLEISVNTVAAAAAATATCQLILSSSVDGGENMVGQMIAMDSSASLTGVDVFRYAYPNSYDNVIRRLTVNRTSGASGTQNVLASHTNFGKFAGVYGSAKKEMATTIEPIILNQNEAISIIPNNIRYSSPLRISLMVVQNSKTFIWTFFANTIPNLSLASISNTSSTPCKIINISISEVGTTDTPYIRVVPVGQIYTNDLNDNSKNITSIIPMDSSYGSLSSSVCKVYSDVGFVPYGVPESYMTETTSGVPKGFNYLNTKDFNGPSYRIFFPELKFTTVDGSENMLGYGYGHKNSDLLFRNAGISLSPGEAIAIVSSAETAASGTPSYSGWTNLNFAAIIDNEPLYSPYLNLTGLVSGSDIVVLEASTSTLLAGSDSLIGSTFSWNYDPDIVNTVDICVYKAGYVPYIVRSIALGINGSSIPISQVVDRNYSNS
jgi:hypothetical protein